MQKPTFFIMAAIFRQKQRFESRFNYKLPINPSLFDVPEIKILNFAFLSSGFVFVQIRRLTYLRSKPYLRASQLQSRALHCDHKIHPLNL